MRFAAVGLTLALLMVRSVSAAPTGTIHAYSSGWICETFGYNLWQVNAIDVQTGASFPFNSNLTAPCRFIAGLPANRIYRVDARATGVPTWFYHYSSSPFTLAPGQVIAHEIPEFGIGWLPGVVALIGACLAIYFTVFPGAKERLVRISQSPSLQVECKPEPPYTHLVLFPLSELISGESPGYSPICFSRVWVMNSGKGDARNVEVFVKRLFLLRSTAKGHIALKPEPGFLPHNLRWANSWDVLGKPRRIDSPSLLSKTRIAVGMGRFCDLGFVIEPRHRCEYFRNKGINAALKSNASVVFDFAFETLTGDGAQRLPREDRQPDESNVHAYILELVIDADNAEPVSQYLEISIEGWRPPASPVTITPAAKRAVDLIEKNTEALVRGEWVSTSGRV